MHQEAAAQHLKEATTLFGLAAEGGRTKEEMRETLQKLAPTLGTSELDDLERAFGEGKRLQRAMTLPAPGKQPVALSARERKLVLRHLRAMIKNDEGDRQLIAEIMARDPALLVDALDAQDGDGVRESIKSKLIAEVRPVLELLSVRAASTDAVYYVWSSLAPVPTGASRCMQVHGECMLPADCTAHDMAGTAGSQHF
jgi:hypothetical protein